MLLESCILSTKNLVFHPGEVLIICSLEKNGETGPERSDGCWISITPPLYRVGGS